jgi:hypothetical protein
VPPDGDGGGGVLNRLACMALQASKDPTSCIGCTYFQTDVERGDIFWCRKRGNFISRGWEDGIMWPQKPEGCQKG